MFLLKKLVPLVAALNGTELLLKTYLNPVLPSLGGIFFIHLYGNKKTLHPNFVLHILNLKSRFMTYRTILNRAIILGFLVGVGFMLAKSIQYKNMLGVILALISLGAAVYFLYLLAKAQQEITEAEREEAL